MFFLNSFLSFARDGLVVDRDVVLLLHGDGADESTTITDSALGGSAPNTVTAQGDAELDTAQKKYGDASIRLPATGGYLSVPDTAGDFLVPFRDDSTFEFQMRLNSDIGTDEKYVLVHKAQSYRITYENNAGVIRVFLYQWSGSDWGVKVEWSQNFAVDTWYHMAFFREGLVFYWFLNGAKQSFVSSSSPLTPAGSTAAPLYLGGDGTGDSVDGWLDEIRVTNNYAWYDGTKATIQQQVQAWTPYAYDPYSVFLSNFTGADAATTADDLAWGQNAPHAMTFNGDAQIDTAQADPFGNNDGVLKLDGTLDSVSLADSADWDLYSSSVSSTVECYARHDVLGTSHSYYSQYETGVLWSRLRKNSDNTVSFQIYQTSGFIVQMTTTYTLSVDTWYHLAVVKDGNDYTLYIDGISRATTTDSSTINLTGVFYVGNFGAAGSDFSGYMTGFRVTQWQARYTANFAPPQEALRTWRYDQFKKLLLNMNGADESTFFGDSARASNAAKQVTAVGNAQIDTAQSKYGGASGLFDGDSDYLTALDSSDWDPAQDFTVECWLRQGETPITYKGIVSHDQIGGTRGWLLLTDSDFSQKVNFSAFDGVTNYNVLSAAALSNDVWTHVAGVKSGNDLMLFVGGILQGTADITGATIGVPSEPLVVGTLWASGAPLAPSHSWDGHIDDVMYCNCAKYTEAFTPPARQLTPYMEND